ncbi:MAG: hypothetical protein ACO3A4_02565, partial [Silvanigrellaceae bacterium]
EFVKAFYGSDCKKREVFKRLRTLDEGKAPAKTSFNQPSVETAPASAPAAPPSSQSPAAAPTMLDEKSDKAPVKQGLPSGDSNPIIVPGESGGGGGGGVISGGGDGGGAPPPPPPAPSGE